jgi:site-specific DNA recombinase
MRWNEQAAWVQSDEISHPPIVSQDTFAQVQQLLISRRTRTGPRERVSTRHVYALAGQVVCDACDRKMQASRANGYVYYRCRFAAEYALANKVSHPRNILIREAELVPALDEWLASQFEPDRVEATIDVLTLAQEDLGAEQQTIVKARHIIHECQAKMARYQAAIDAGADVQEISRWINAAKAESLAAVAALRSTSDAPGRMSRDEVAILVDRTASVTAALREAELEDKAALYKDLNLRLTYEHATRTVRAEAQLGECPFWDKVRVRGGT